MAKRRSRRRRNYNRFQAIPFESSLTLSTLADNTVVVQNLLGAEFAEDFYTISIDAIWSLLGHTAGEGPITVGFAHNDLSTGEIKENLDAEITDPDNIIAREMTRRPVRKSGTFPGLATNETLNHGDPKKTTMKFMVGDGHGLEQWAINRSNAALTTGTVVVCEGTIFGRWIR